ncbi:MAG: RNA methyltransferase [Deltaproteobacteria bacterium]|nr:RNA methyltransferase [Deltaproteobacteria bacterium]
MSNTEITRERIKEIKRLHESRERAEKGLLLIEGIRLMEEAVKEKVSFEEVLYTQRIEDTDRGIAVLAALRKGRAPLYPVSEKVMQSVAETESPQGILGVLRHLVWDIKDVTKGRGTVVVACGLQDPGNLGTIIRTADAGGCGGVVTTQNTVDIYNSKVIRATMGSIFRTPVLKFEDPKEAISALKKDGYQIIATTARSKTSYLDIDYMKPTAFLIGQEAAGIPDDLLESADIKVFIPMKVGVESLNAAVSASILIYEVFRQKLRQHP